MIAEDMMAIRMTRPSKRSWCLARLLSGEGRTHGDRAASQYNCTGFRLLAAGSVYAWELRQDGADVTVQVRGTTLATDPLYFKDLALACVGIAYVFEPLVRDEIRAKRLRWIMPDAAIEEPGLFLYFPRRASKTPKLRAFLDVMREVLKS
jgi:DNA-binding transcriptional LysR family regulator